MGKEKQTPETQPVESKPQTFEVVGFEKSNEMMIAIDGRQVNLANPSEELTAWLFERKDRLSGLQWI